MLKTRIISACVFVPIIFLASLFGGVVFALLMAFIAIVGGYEFGNLLNEHGYRFRLPLFIISSLCFLIGAYFSPEPDILLLLLFLILVVHGVLFVMQKLTIDEAAVSFFGIIYIGFTLSSAVAIRLHMESGMYLIFLIFIIQWLTDTGAYLIGCNFGKHKLMPKISPKKSVEGAIGGIVFAVISALIFNLIFHLLPLGYLLLLAVVASILGQLGDLVESAFKRWAGVKDSGNLIPGHGGVLDRFDSFLFIAPFFYTFLFMYMTYIK